MTATNGNGSTAVLPGAETQAVASAAFRTFYISTSGSDSYTATQAQNSSTPWRHAPGMVGFTGSYTAQTGDHFVFQGGDDFTGVFPLTPANSGTATASYYYGVDPTWYTGSSYTAPTFDDGGTASTTFVSLGSHSYIEVDGIHFTGFHWTGASGTPRAMITAAAPGTDQSVTNSLFDGWSHDAASGCSSGSCDSGWAIWNNEGTGMLVQGNQFDQSTGSYDSGGAYDENGGSGTIFDRNTCFHLTNCYMASGGGVISNNVIHDMGYGDYDSTNHQNDIEAMTGNNVIYDNLVYNTFYGSFTIDYHASGTNYIYNNVVWNNGREAIDADCSLGGGCGSGTNYLYNNTLAPSGACFRFVNRGSGENTYLNVTEDNNHCIGSLNGIDSGASITNLTQNTNLTQTSSEATSTGYTSSNEFAPTTATSPTVGTGTNLTTACTGDVLSLCTSIDDHPRPTGTTAWDEGAY